MSGEWMRGASRHGLGDLRTRVVGCDRATVRAVVEGIGARLDRAELELLELRRRVGLAEEELATGDDEAALEEAIGLSRRLAAAVTSEARDQVEAQAAEAARRAAELERRERAALEELAAEVARAASRIAERRRGIEEALRAALAALDDVPGPAPEALDAAVRALGPADQRG